MEENELNKIAFAKCQIVILRNNKTLGFPIGKREITLIAEAILLNKKNLII